MDIEVEEERGRWRLDSAPETTAGGVRQVDIIVAERTAAIGGRYSVDLHLRHDHAATDQFAETHVRRLEALRRQSDVAVREPDGSWTLHPDHLEGVTAHEACAAKKTPAATSGSRCMCTTRLNCLLPPRYSTKHQCIAIGVIGSERSASG